ncbi:MAG: type II toxin-antitoxin system VapC family toxin [Thermoplasmata archaeon]
MSVLDTDFLVGLLRQDPEAQEKLQSLAAEGDTAMTTVVNALELYKGAFLSRAPTSARESVDGLLERVERLDLEASLAPHVAEVAADLIRRGRSIGDFDTIIGTMALAVRQAVVTRNVDHFRRIPGLQVETW